jgi:hypothetical protein
MRGKPAVIAFVTTGSLPAQAQVDYLVAMARNDGDRVNYAVVALEDRDGRELRVGNVRPNAPARRERRSRKRRLRGRDRASVHSRRNWPDPGGSRTRRGTPTFGRYAARLSTDAAGTALGARSRRSDGVREPNSGAVRLMDSIRDPVDNGKVTHVGPP